LKKLYWDTSVFLCFLNAAERERAQICEDILVHAESGEILIYTSTWTIVETIKPKKVSLPNAKLLTPSEIAKIEGMFRWAWIRRVTLDPRIAFMAVQLVRDQGMNAADAVHAASAILSGVDALQKWDRDFSKVAHLIKVEEPFRITPQLSLIEMAPRIAPSPDDFPGISSQPDSTTKLLTVEGEKELLSLPEPAASAVQGKPDEPKDPKP